ncbi:MAG: DNA-3-methyladenine glycosylase [Acidimicrobiia bacterium]
MARRLTRAFYARDSLELAPQLLNKIFVHDGAEGRVAVRIVEVEAYRGSRDPGSHAFRGMTPRTAAMFGPPGQLYVYFTYGMHWCANVVAWAPPGEASAVLLRAGEPLEGLDVMRARRPAARRDRDLCSGPARLTQALGIAREHDGVSLLRGSLGIFDDGVVPPRRPGRSTRIGLAPGRGDTSRWRWFVPGNEHVSRHR